ncbi:MAG: hypothetical protein KH613_02950 [Veillonella sp.]|uniref:hypothetical protein n=1 Tax=Veillonella sp. TaxID=1926307 RepID=UPI001D5868C0|nr:hypothetical protein [Veillonella sp.]MBS6186102.1 hypothetical protein [Veillonella sp.]
MINTEELFKHGFDEVEFKAYQKCEYLTLKCRDYMTDNDLNIALQYARKVAKDNQNGDRTVFIKIKDSIGYRVLSVEDIIELKMIDRKVQLTENSFTTEKILITITR